MLFSERKKEKTFVDSELVTQILNNVSGNLSQNSSTANQSQNLTNIFTTNSEDTPENDEPDVHQDNETLDANENNISTETQGNISEGEGEVIHRDKRQKIEFSPILSSTTSSTFNEALQTMNALPQAHFFGKLKRFHTDLDSKLPLRMSTGKFPTYQNVGTNTNTISLIQSLHLTNVNESTSQTTGRNANLLEEKPKLSPNQWILAATFHNFSLYDSALQKVAELCYGLPPLHRMISIFQEKCFNHQNQVQLTW
jgi:hypothetical protein